jgi:M6 family metalloprotease-like protein
VPREAHDDPHPASRGTNRKRHLRFLVGLLVLLLVLTGRATAGDNLRNVQQCGTTALPGSSQPLDETGGIYITSKGTLRVLVVFASFPDDETPHPYWPAHNPPLFMQQFIDPDTGTHSQNSFNLTNYFRQMSLGQFHVVGEAVWVESAHSQEEYRNGSYGRANTDVLPRQVDSLVDFSKYDQWTRLADFSHANTPDGAVDMIIMVWRTTMFEYLGEASLGYKPAIMADGKRIDMGYPMSVPLPAGSGVTCEYPYGDSPQQVMRTMAHEVGHWLLGGFHPYNGLKPDGKHQFWGILCAGQRLSSCANAYDRERLGWITIPELPPDHNVSLADFVTTGSAYKYHPPAGEPREYFYMENHQQLSVFDDVTANPRDKGVWILHQQGPYAEMDNLRITASDGYWRWENSRSTAACFSQTLPVFRKVLPRVQAGESHRDQIPTPSSVVDWMYVYEDASGMTNCGSFLAGELFGGAFTPYSSSVFSPASNPASNTWNGNTTTFSLELTGETAGVITMRYNSNPLDASPARRYLGVDPTAQDVPAGSLPLAWGASWVEGQSLESDVNWSELERRSADEGSWTAVYQGSSTVWRDSSLNYDSGGTIPVFFRVRMRDTQGKDSRWSNEFPARAAAVTGVGNRPARNGSFPERVVLEANYPNPFNPSTAISFSLPERRSVRLELFDLLGRIVKVLVNEEVEGGRHRVVWDGMDAGGTPVAGGVYLCRLQTGAFSSTMKIMVLR